MGEFFATIVLPGKTTGIVIGEGQRLAIRRAALARWEGGAADDAKHARLQVITKLRRPAGAPKGCPLGMTVPLCALRETGDGAQAYAALALQFTHANRLVQFRLEKGATSAVILSGSLSGADAITIRATKSAADGDEPARLTQSGLIPAAPSELHGTPDQVEAEFRALELEEVAGRFAPPATERRPPT